MADFENTWSLVEASIFGYLDEKLEGTGLTAFLGELPRAANKVADLKMWYFSMSGGSSVVPVQVKRSTWNGWRMDGVIGAMFTEDEREEAQRFAGLALNCLPITLSDKVDGCTFCDITSMPSLERDTVYLKSDLSQGGEVRIWKLSIPLEIVFSNISS